MVSRQPTLNALFQMPLRDMFNLPKAQDSAFSVPKALLRVRMGNWLADLAPWLLPRQPKLHHVFHMPCRIFQPASRSGSCVLCALGQFQEAAGQQACLSCPTGFFSAKTPTVDCSRCPAGYAQNTSGSSACDACERGSFQSQHGQRGCQRCRPGRVAAIKRQTLCHECLPGHFAGSEALSICMPCAEGTIAPEHGAKNCTRCSKGTYYSFKAGTVCTPCPAGYAAEGDGSVRCLKCLAGFFAKRQSSCKECPMGRFSASRASANCSACPRGRVTIVNGSRGCSIPSSCRPWKLHMQKWNTLMGLHVNVTVAKLGAAVPRFTVHAFRGRGVSSPDKGQNAKLAQEGSLPLNDGRAEIVLQDGVRYGTRYFLSVDTETTRMRDFEHAVSIPCPAHAWCNEDDEDVALQGLEASRIRPQDGCWRSQRTILNSSVAS